MVARRAQTLLRPDVVDLDDDTVDLVLEPVALRGEPLAVAEDGIEGDAALVGADSP
jgi:hypothetical protein